MSSYKMKRLMVKIKSLFKEVLSEEEFTKDDIIREAKDLANEILLHDIHVRFQLLEKIKERVELKSIEEMDELSNRLNKYKTVLETNKII